MRIVLTLAIVAALLLLGTQGPVALSNDGWTLYDDFNAKRIDPARWEGGGTSPLALGFVATRPYHEVALEQAQGRLKMELQTYSIPVTSDEYQGLILELNMSKTQAALPRGVQVKARIEEIDVKGCDRVGARIYAWLFRNAFNSDPNDLTNTVYARVDITAFPMYWGPKTLRISHRVVQCDNSDCTAVTLVERADFGDAVVGTEMTISLFWDASAKTITFAKNSEEFPYYYPAGWQVTTLNTLLTKGIYIFADGEYCTPLGAWIKTTFDDFKTKQ